MTDITGHVWQPDQTPPALPTPLLYPGFAPIPARIGRSRRISSSRPPAYIRVLRVGPPISKMSPKNEPTAVLKARDYARRRVSLCRSLWGNDRTRRSGKTRRRCICLRPRRHHDRNHRAAALIRRTRDESTGWLWQPLRLCCSARWRSGPPYWFYGPDQNGAAQPLFSRAGLRPSLSDLRLVPAVQVSNQGAANKFPLKINPRNGREDYEHLHEAITISDQAKIAIVDASAGPTIAIKLMVKGPRTTELQNDVHRVWPRHPDRFGSKIIVA